MSKDAELITDELVAAIADRMVEAGKRVSPVTIWSEARGGSLVEIVAALERWRETRQPRTPDLQVETGLPEGLAEAIMSAAGRIWTTSQDEAEKAFNPRLTAMGERVEAALAERDEALAEFQRLNDEIDAGRERLAASNDALNSSELMATRLEAELATATGRADVAETREADLVQRVAVIEADLETTLAALAEERRARDELRLVVEGKDFEIAQLTLERDDSRQEAASQRDACRAKSEEVEWWSQEAGTVTLRAQAAEARVEEVTQRLAMADAGLAAANVSLEEERRAREESATLIAGKNDEIALLRQDLDHARQEVATLSATCQTRLEEVEKWSQEANAAATRAQAAEFRGEELAQRISVADSDLDATRASLEDARRARDESATLLASKNDELARLTQDFDGAQQQVASLSAACDAKSEEVEKWSQEASAVTTRAQAAEMRVDELLQRASSAQAELDGTRTSLDEERSAREALAATLAGKSDELIRLAQERDEGLQQIASLSDANRTKADEVERWSLESSAANSRAQLAEQRVEELLHRASVDNANLETTRISLEKAQREREALSATLGSKSDELAQLIQQHDDARQQIAMLSNTSQAKSEEVDKWTQEASAANSRAQNAEAHANDSLTRLAAREAELDEARTALAAEHQTAATRLAEASTQRDELQRISQQLDATREQLGTLNDAKAAASAELTRVSQDASAAKERADAAERYAAQLAQRLAELAEAAAQDAQGGPHPGARADDSESAEEVAVLQRQLSAQTKAHEKALNDLRSNAEQWVVHARDLKQRLGQAGERMLFVDARSTGEVALVRRLASELERLKPDHELISRDAQQKLIAATMSQQLAQKGYQYDPATAVMSKIDS
ncbi:chromosome segregation ATPase [Paraburkholderia sp. GAS41]|jgi:chromosome segregation ATPase|uniref:DNA-binding protein n=1 Tax=Paraburkholderia sp. GAS41 TaxID=3035134 RepID=UPI003D19DE8D